jgi:hypothetical protein
MPQPPFPYEVQEVTIEAAGGVRLAGTLSLPRAASPGPAVVLVPGAGATDRDDSIMGHKPFLVLADHLARKGIASLRLDSRGVGGSTGNYAQSDGEALAGDLRAAAGFLAKQKGVNSRAIGLVGHSQGGIVSALAGAGSRDVSFLVLLASPGLSDTELFERRIVAAAQSKGLPASDYGKLQRAFRESREKMFRGEIDDQARGVFADVVRLMLPAGMNLPAEALAGAVERQIAASRTPNASYFLALDPRTVYRRVRCPVLALNGSRDQNVPADENLQAIQCALNGSGNRKLRTQVFDGLNHFFQTAKTGSPAEIGQIEETMAQEVLEAISRWILQP